MNNHSVSSFNKLQHPSCTWLFPSNYCCSLLLTYTHIHTCSHTRVHACLPPVPTLLTHCLYPPQLCTALHLSSMSQELTFLREKKVFILKGKVLLKKQKSRIQIAASQDRFANTECHQYSSLLSSDALHYNRISWSVLCFS